MMLNSSICRIQRNIPDVHVSPCDVCDFYIKLRAEDNSSHQHLGQLHGQKPMSVHYSEFSLVWLKFGWSVDVLFKHPSASQPKAASLVAIHTHTHTVAWAVKGCWSPFRALEDIHQLKAASVVSGTLEYRSRKCISDKEVLYLWRFFFFFIISDRL